MRQDLGHASAGERPRRYRGAPGGLPFTGEVLPFAQLAGRVREAALETLSPTRCCGCERPGSLICDACISQLALIDPVLSCSRCAAPFGSMLCTECARDALHAGAERNVGTSATKPPGPEPQPQPFERCLAMATFDAPLPRIIRSYKDAGERRLAPLMAELLLETLLHAEDVAPERYGGILGTCDAITFVPATAAAYRRRGFDHMEAIARVLAELSDKPLADALVKHGKIDQRDLGREERRTRSRGAYECVAGVFGLRLLLIDDVITTGATLSAAAAELKRAGAAHIDTCALARVW